MFSPEKITQNSIADKIFDKCFEIRLKNSVVIS